MIMQSTYRGLSSWAHSRDTRLYDGSNINIDRIINNCDEYYIYNNFTSLSGLTCALNIAIIKNV
ncbi:MAG: hypothetical protein P857_351 [Candidatus Xenolissoclinum pacificiensis L6]|uniref:Uncharacterized protein n=1 Tax=Candidatus Xenolissoclinum pacificiensis L6 TaxID=1401685 RepID=W2UZ63_9RICK|nr:MAG: hypothetical protein P857_351 [Candidatus Xenolissoclinum pacificiensis L6]